MSFNIGIQYTRQFTRPMMHSAYVACMGHTACHALTCNSQLLGFASDNLFLNDKQLIKR